MKAKYLPLLFLLVAAVISPRISAQNATLYWDKVAKAFKASAPISVEPKTLGANYALRVTPYLADAKGDTLFFSDVVFRSPRNAKLRRRHRYFAEELPATSPELSVGEVYQFEATVKRSEAPWICSGDQITLGYKQQREGCCNEMLLGSQFLAQSHYERPVLPPAPAFNPRLAYVEEDKGEAGLLAKHHTVLSHDSTYIPYTPDRIMSREEGLLRVHFPLDKIDLRRDFRGNDTILDQVVHITNAILADTKSTVTRIQVIGFASVEGTQKRNSWLGQGRADALCDYVIAHTKATRALFDINNGKEGWSELRYAIEQSSMEGRDALLNIIDTEPDLDRREARMKKLDGGRPWAYLKKNILPNQRNSGYVRIFYTYEPDTTARTINAATALLEQKRYAEALQMLQDVRDDDRAQNALGVALYMTGDTDGALRAFDRAAKSGDEGARQNAKAIREIQEYNARMANEY